MISWVNKQVFPSSSGSFLLDSLEVGLYSDWYYLYLGLFANFFSTDLVFFVFLQLLF